MNCEGIMKNTLAQYFPHFEIYIFLIDVKDSVY